MFVPSCTLSLVTYVVSVTIGYQLYRKDNTMAKPKIGIIVGSTRPNRFADKPTEWIEKIARARGDIDVEVLDLRDYPLPFFNEAVSPAWGPSQSEVAQKWQKKVAELDGFVIVTAEYN